MEKRKKLLHNLQYLCRLNGYIGFHFSVFSLRTIVFTVPFTKLTAFLVNSLGQSWPKPSVFKPIVYSLRANYGTYTIGTIVQQISFALLAIEKLLESSAGIKKYSRNNDNNTDTSFRYLFPINLTEYKRKIGN